jgi:isoquinoline 1-oxidoreductase beta subunit
MHDTLPLSRRRFLKIMAGSAGALVIGIGAVHAADTPDMPLTLLGDAWSQVGPYLRIDADGRVIIGARDPDNGEGTQTSLPRMVADELDAHWESVVVVSLGLGVEDGNGEPRWLYGRQRSGDGSSIPAAWNDMRQAGALARALLLQAAAQRLGLAADQLHTEAGMVIAADGRRFSFGQLASDAAQLSAPETAPPLKTPDRFKLIGQPAGDVDAHAVVTGQLSYAIDEAGGDALIAVLSRCPFPGGKLGAVDTEDTLKVPGVVQVIQLQPETDQPLGMTAQAPAVAVLAESTWAALQGRAKLKLQWTPGATPVPTMSDLERQAQVSFDGSDGLTTILRDDGDAVATLKKKGARRVDATYVQPWIAHATAEPLSCIVRIDPGESAAVITASQSPRDAYTIVQRLTGLRASQIQIKVPRGGGAFGRRLYHDHLAEALMIAMADKPDNLKNRAIKLMWTRDEDLAHDIWRAPTIHRMSAAIDTRKGIVSWMQKMASAPLPTTQPTRAWASELLQDALPAGLVSNFRSSWYALNTPVPRGEWRGTPHLSHAFASESFIDEIANALKANPLDVRLRLLGDPRPLPYRGRGGPTVDTGRLANVLKLVAARIDWSRWLHSETGLGIACYYANGGYVAHALEVANKGNGQIDLVRAVCAVDVGRVINPLGLEAQVAGATIDALSTAMNLSISFRDNQVQQHNFRDYSLANSAQMPNDIEVITVASDAPPAGASVLAMPTAAPALANAVFRATAVRVRRLPLLRELARMS